MDPQQNKSRKLRRKPRNIALEFPERQQSKKWLETHVWHAKRFKMIDIWGYRLPLQSNQKAIKFCYRSAQKYCLFSDLSFMQCWEIHASNILEVGKLFGITSMLNGVLMNGHLSHNSSLICPMELLWNESKSMLWLWTHPSCNDQVQLAFKNIQESHSDFQFENIASQLNRFSLIGPLKQRILGNVLQNYQQLKPGDVLNLTVNDPRFLFPQKRISPEDSSPFELGRSESSSKLWNKAYRDNQVRISDAEMNKRRSENPIPGSKLQPLSSDSSIDVILMATTKSSICSSWDILIPQSRGMDFWLSFIFSGCKPAGLEEMNKNSFEGGERTFPQDYPGTEAYQSWMQEWCRKEQELWSKKPPAKRCNYEKLGILNPFDSSIENIMGRLVKVESLKPCRLFMKKRNAERLARIIQDDEIVGFVTTGEFCLSMGRSCGIGVCLSNINPSTPVLVRNIQSSDAFEATIEFME